MSDKKIKAESYNLDHPINKEALSKIDIDAFLGRCQDASSSQLDAFKETICNEQKCPIGWLNCQGKEGLNCWYFELATSIRRSIL